MPAAKYNTELFPDKSQGDVLAQFDYVRFSRPSPGKLAGRELAGISDAELLALIK